jgi:pimeloyl-ACP methyl ester carboxylesterase
MKEGYLQSRGIAYRVSDFKPGRKTLLFIHGLSGSLSVWYPYESLADEYNVITVDLRGHGLSKRYKKYKDYDLATVAEDVAILLEDLNVQSCVVISHSLGALVALELIHSHPQKIAKAIFISPAAQSNKLFFYHLRHPLREMGVITGFLLSILRRPQGRTDYEHYKHTGDWNLFRTYADVSNMGRLTYLRALNNLYAFAHNEWWREIQIPTLFLHGSQDTMVPLT